MQQLRAELEANPPLTGSYTPRPGELCASKFMDGEWYRARVEKVTNNNKISVFYVDFGNVSTVKVMWLFLSSVSKWHTFFFFFLERVNIYKNESKYFTWPETGRVKLFLYNYNLCSYSFMTAWHNVCNSASLLTTSLPHTPASSSSLLSSLCQSTQRCKLNLKSSTWTYVYFHCMYLC